MLQNTSGLKPLGRAVLIEMLKANDPKRGMIEIPQHVRESSTIMEQHAKVIAIGACCWNDEPEPRCGVGDKVIVTKMAGYVTRGPADGKLYRMVNDRDVFCKITSEEAANV